MAENAAADGKLMAILTDFNNLLKSENARLKQENEKLSQEKKCLQEENDRLKQEKSSLQQTRSNLQKEIAKTREENNKLKQDKIILQQENDALKQESDALKQKSDRLQNDNQRMMEDNLRWITQDNLTKQELQQQTHGGQVPSWQHEQQPKWTGDMDDRKPSTSGYQNQCTSQNADKRSLFKTRQTYSPRTKELIKAELANPREKTAEVWRELADKAGKTEKQMRAALYYRVKRRPTEHSQDGNDSSDEVEVMN